MRSNASFRPKRGCVPSLRRTSSPRSSRHSRPAATATSSPVGDIITLVDGREELVDEVAQAPDDVRAYIAAELADLLEDPRIADGLFGAMQPDPASQARIDAVVMPRLRTLIA